MKAYDEEPILAACVTQAAASEPALSTTSDLAGEKNTIQSFLVSAREINEVLIVLAPGPVTIKEISLTRVDSQA
jgi:hypothetical protein